MEGISFAMCAQAEADLSEFHSWMVLNGADGWWFPSIM